MTRHESLGLGRCALWEELIAARDADWRELLADAQAAIFDPAVHLDEASITRFAISCITAACAGS